MFALRPFPVLIALLLGALLPAQRDRVSPTGPSISPFRAMRPVQDGIEVQVDDDTWFALERIEGVDAATLLSQSRELCGDNWWERLTEDLPALFAAMGHDVGQDVDLRLRRLDTGELVELQSVAMTREKRQRLLRANQGARGGAAAPRPAAAPRVRADGPKVSPFRAMRPVQDGIEVQVDDDTWFALEQIEGVDAATLLSRSRELAGGNWWKRLTEDLPALFAAMGHDVGRDVDLRLRRLDTGELVELRSVPMTGEKRNMLRRANHGDRGGAGADRVSANGPSISPFRAMRPVQDGIEVQVDDDTWFALEEIEGVDAATLLSRSRELAGGNWWKRLTEDLPALFAAMGHDIGRDVDLRLRRLDTGELVELRSVEMTGEKRRMLWGANQGLGALRGLFAPAPAERGELAQADAVADLDALRELLDARFSYRHRRVFDLDALLAAATDRLRTVDGDRRAQLAVEVDRVLRAFGDGHSRLGGGQLPRAEYWLPFLVQRARGGFVAFRADRSGLVDPAHPFVEQIDGLPLERWHSLLRERARQGSPAMIERDIERDLRELQALRRELGVEDAPVVRVTLRGADGSAEVSLPAATRRPIYGAWPQTETRRLGADVGYLRLPQMRDEPAFLDGIDDAMHAFRDCKALVIDVRGNGGGSRDALRRVFPYLLGAADGPQVVNAAKILLATRPDGAGVDGELLENRGMHRADWAGWSDAQRRAVRAFAASFTPEWQPPAEQFSDWHYLVLDRSDNPRAFPFAGKVAVLMDGGCFSATDIFLAALGTRPNVTLVGSASSGGSGRARGYRLPRSGIALQLSSMASFQPNGLLFEGHGVEPDLRVEIAPTDLIEGGTDSVLDAALGVLRR
ncbi:MAG: S41 family peptidase [Planctomycetota bacterium]